MINMEFDRLIVELLPALRATVAKKLSSSGMKQTDIAKKLNITQPAVSQYNKERRGSSRFFRENPEFGRFIEKLADEVLKGKEMKQATVEVIELAMEQSLGIKGKVV